MHDPLCLIAAGPEHEPVLANLLELYIHDFSEFIAKDVGEDGRFGYAQLSLYWSDPRRRPFLARYEDKWAGFALVRKTEEDVWDMAEFFILRRYRRTGLGRELAEKVWRRFPGRWQVRVRADNGAARAFWETSIARFADETLEAAVVQIDGMTWNLFSFESHG
ncbi:MAG TPA: GNAT family N-acetyltransferase [Terracidiphilus sp.]|jgi:predicted acetyltransferase|nr:GNAT family N-acetyltransferase [Terracidiphilus sp.]